MFLDASKIPEIYRLLATGKREAIDKLRRADISLTVSLFIALAHQTAVNKGDQSLWKMIEELGLAGVERGVRCLSFSGQQCSPDPFGAPALDIHRIASEADLTSQEWVLFYDRFRRSASGKRKSPMFRGVGGILGEILLNADAVDLREDLEDYLEGKGKVLIIANEVEGGLQFDKLIGTLDRAATETYQELCRAREVTAQQLYDRFPGRTTNQTAWNNRLAQLLELRIARRRREGRLWIYQPTVTV